MLDDSLARDLDTAMLVRRDNLPGSDTPAGLLTKMRGTRYESLIKEIEDRADPATLELGFHLLSMAEESCRDIDTLLKTITRKTQVDGKRHDATLASSTDLSGISFHCNPKPSVEAVATLETHCAKRKYAQRAPQWFGVSVGPAPDGHPKLLHLWPVKLLQAGRTDYEGSGVMAIRAAASLSR